LASINNKSSCCNLSFSKVRVITSLGGIPITVLLTKITVLVFAPEEWMAKAVALIQIKQICYE
jgi:hypothetical protein